MLFLLREALQLILDFFLDRYLTIEIRSYENIGATAFAESGICLLDLVL